MPECVCMCAREGACGRNSWRRRGLTQQGRYIHLYTRYRYISCLRGGKTEDCTCNKRTFPSNHTQCGSRTHTQRNANTHAHTHARKHTQTHTYTHKHTHTHARTSRTSRKCLDVATSVQSSLLLQHTRLTIHTRHALHTHPQTHIHTLHSPTMYVISRYPHNSVR